MAIERCYRCRNPLYSDLPPDARDRWGRLKRKYSARAIDGHIFCRACARLVLQTRR